MHVIDATTRAARVIVPDFQLSLAIGKEGQNARLAARLTGWRIDIRSDAAAPEGGPILHPVHPRAQPAEVSHKACSEPRRGDGRLSHDPARDSGR